MLKINDLRCEYKKNPIGVDTFYPRFSYKIYSTQRNILQTFYRIQVSEDDDSFMNIVWDSDYIESDQSIHIEYNGSKLKTCTRYFYRVKIKDNKGNTSTWSDISYFETGFLSKEEWKAYWITPSDDLAKINYDASFYKEIDTIEPCPILRKSFLINGKIKSARLYCSCLGLYELHLNRAKLGDYLFTPGWTTYSKRIQYQTYDVTKILTQDKNAISIIIGDGWFKGNLTWKNIKNFYGDKLAAIIQLKIEYEDGQEELILSDNTWKSINSPILMSDIYMGEIYDANLELDGFDSSNYDDSDWYGVNILNHSKEILIAQENEPVKIIEEISPINIIKTPQGDTVIDMGQNMSGFIRFSVNGEKGTLITLSHAEVLDKDGNFYTENLRSAKQTIKYILNGIAIETFQPHFCFQGFRYVKVDGYPREIKLTDFKGIVIHSDMEQIGDFECSDTLINKLQHNILWGLKGNFIDVPTDCPQRDERLGWTGDAQVFIRTACFNMNVAPFFSKWLKDLYLEQTKEKGVPFVVPNMLDDKSYSSSAWGDAAVICPWTIYLCFGDKRILKEQYNSMKDWVEYIRAQGKNEYLWNTGFHFGDWLGLDAREGSYIGATATDYIATAFYAYSTKLLIKTAEILNYCEDKIKYTNLYNKIIENFRNEFLTSNGRLAVSTQTGYVLALMFELIDGEAKERAINALIENIKENKYHLTTGFVGTPYLCHVLSQNGFSDIAYKLLFQDDYPSWLYQIKKGATTIWEHWDGIKEDGTFWSKDMNSFNHYAYGSIGDWLYRNITGIELDSKKAGYKHFFIKPKVYKQLTYAKASYNSMYGNIKVSWEILFNNLILNITIPANTTATVILPAIDIANITLDSLPISNNEGVSSLNYHKKNIEFDLGSGEYCLKIADLELF